MNMYHNERKTLNYYFYRKIDKKEMFFPKNNIKLKKFGTLKYTVRKNKTVEARQHKMCVRQYIFNVFCIFFIYQSTVKFSYHVVLDPIYF